MIYPWDPESRIPDLVMHHNEALKIPAGILSVTLISIFKFVSKGLPNYSSINMRVLYWLSYFFLPILLLPDTLSAQNIHSGFEMNKPFDQLSEKNGARQGLRSSVFLQTREAKMNEDILHFSTTLGESYTVSVVFHIISEDPAIIPDQLILDGLKDLNDAFAKTGIYVGSAGADTKIHFCLAQKDPDGGNSSGITRTKSFYGDFDQDIEDGRVKNLVQWDPKKYINIWYVEGIRSETLPRFSCGKWSRRYEGGYATIPTGPDSTDGIVVTAFGALMAHEMGHYLGLYHTFEGLNCANNNCATEGDRVCDTPPDASYNNSVSCTQPQNSCSSDTLSGFTVNVPDMISNFMDYGNEACHNAFTEGQASRMRAMIATQRSGLLQNQCSKPCAENSQANFSRNNPYPVPGNAVLFTNTSSGASAFEWSVDGTAISSAKNFTYTFTSNGKYKVSLKALNANPSCYAMYSDFIIVNCGVVSRFYPDKRLIASKTPIYPDSIYFTNRSVNATSFQWLMSHGKDSVENVVSTAKDLNYIFQDPGDYLVRLIASNGSCSDTSEKFNFTVLDPTPDATLSFRIVDCYEQTKIRVELSVCNYGFAPVPAGTPVSFYEGDPRTSNARLLDNHFVLPDTIFGICCNATYTHIISVNRTGLDTLYAVLNDDGTTIPLHLPNGPLPELSFQNNLAIAKNFQWKVKIDPGQATLEPGDTLQLNSIAGPGMAGSYLWTNARGLSCDTCAAPLLIADSTTVKKVVATSAYGCLDSATTNIQVPPADDFTVRVDSIYCGRNDSLLVEFTLCNGFKRGHIPKNLPVAFYDRDPTDPGAKMLNPVFNTLAEGTTKCNSFRHLINGFPGGKLFAVVNDQGNSIPVNLPNDSNFLEKNYANNIGFGVYSQDTLVVSPDDTTVLANQSFPIHIESGLANSGTINWLSGIGYSLSCDHCASPIITPHNSSIVRVELINPFGCILLGQAKITTITGGKVNIPNAFTPNGDGRNEIFYIMGGKEIRILEEFDIFNRWGERIFHAGNVPANDPSFGWNGMYGGKWAETGTYVYFARIRFNDGSLQLFKGTVTLIR